MKIRDIDKHNAVFEGRIRKRGTFSAAEIAQFETCVTDPHTLKVFSIFGSGKKIGEAIQFRYVNNLSQVARGILTDEGWEAYFRGPWWDVTLWSARVPDKSRPPQEWHDALRAHSDRLLKCNAANTPTDTDAECHRLHNVQKGLWDRYEAKRSANNASFFAQLLREQLEALGEAYAGHSIVGAQKR